MEMVSCGCVGVTILLLKIHNLKLFAQTSPSVAQSKSRYMLHMCQISADSRSSFKVLIFCLKHSYSLSCLYNAELDCHTISIVTWTCSNNNVPVFVKHNFRKVGHSQTEVSVYMLKTYWGNSIPHFNTSFYAGSVPSSTISH